MNYIKIFILVFFIVGCQAVLNACNDANTTCTSSTILSGLPDHQQHCYNSCTLNGTNEKFTINSQGCEASPFATVWYTIPAFETKKILSIDVESSDLRAPMLSLYSGDCSSLQLAYCNQGSSGTVSLTEISLAENTTYLLAVANAQNYEGDFNLCITAKDSPNVCNTASSLLPKKTSMGSPTWGPYLPGEKIEFCYTINGYQNVSCNYLHTIMPIFGKGWDTASFDAEGQPQVTSSLSTQGHTNFTTANPVCEGNPAGEWLWYPEGTIQYNLNSENPMALTRGEFISGAWVFLNSFDPSCFDFTDACCTNPTTDPNVGYGDDNYPICGAGINHEWQVCFELIVDETLANANDCSITMKTMADGETGNFISKACKADEPVYFLAPVQECIAPELSLIQDKITVCPREEFEIEIRSNKNMVGYWIVDENEEISLLEQSSFKGSLTEGGTYNFQVFGSNGCISDPMSFQIEVVESLEVEIEQIPAIACLTEEVELSAITKAGLSQSELRYNWNQSPGLNQSSLKASDANINYMLEVNYYGCKTSLVTTLKVHEQSTVVLSGDEELCPDASSFLDLSFTGTGPWNLILEDENGKELTVDSAEDRIQYEVEKTRDFSFRIISGIDANGCEIESLGEVHTSFMQGIDISAGSDLSLGCAIDEVELTGSMADIASDYDINWISAQGHEILLETTMYPIVNETGEYILEITELDSGCVSRDTVQVTQREPEIGLVLDEESVELALGETIDLVAHIDLPEEEIAEVLWIHDGTLACETCMITAATPIENTSYTITIIDVYGCSETKEVKVTVRTIVEEISQAIYVPNTFNPSATDENNTFTIFGDNNIKMIESFQIFDRWGNEIYSVEMVPNEADLIGWDGNYNGSTVESGVYVYMINILLLDDTDLSLVGQVTILN